MLSDSPMGKFDGLKNIGKLTKKFVALQKHLAECGHVFQTQKQSTFLQLFSRQPWDMEGEMTYKEFKRQVFMIYNETYNGADVSPIEYGIQRAKFEETKLERLISLASQTDFSTAKRKVEGWRRQLERVHEIRARLERRRIEAPAIVRMNSPVAPEAVARSRSSQSVRLR